MSDELTFSIYELTERIRTDEDARLYLESQRWEYGLFCPHCGSETKQYVMSRKGYYRCGECRKTYTVKTGTIFERSHIGLSKWLLAVYFIITARKGISSVQLSKHLGVNQKTAWFMLQKIREGMGEGLAILPQLAGIVEIDETYIGGKETNKHSSKKLKAGRGTVGKIPVIGIKERGGNVFASVVEHANAETADAEIEYNVDENAEVMTDESAIYRNVSQKRKHHRVNHSAKQFVDGMASTNGIESVWALLKRMFYGVYHKFSMNRIESLLFGSFQKRLTYLELTAEQAVW